MAGERSDRTAPKATADQPPTEGEPAYRPHDDRLAPEHEEPLDGPVPDDSGAAEDAGRRGSRPEPV